MAKLTIHDKGKPRLYEILEDAVYIGKSQESHVRLRDPGVAGVHCQIKRTRTGYRLIDLESKVGTRVNGEFVNQHALEDGDEIELGSTRILFEDEPRVAFEGSATRRRLEREAGPLSRIPPWGIGVIVASVALFLAVLVLFVLRGNPPAGAIETMKADKLFSEGRFEEALELIRTAREAQEIDPAFEKEFRRIEEAIAGQKESTEKIERAYNFEASANEVVRFANSEENKKSIEMKDEVLSRFDRWLEEHKDAPAYLIKKMNETRDIVQRHYERMEASRKRRDNW